MTRVAVLGELRFHAQLGDLGRAVNRRLIGPQQRVHHVAARATVVDAGVRYIDGECVRPHSFVFARLMRALLIGR